MTEASTIIDLVQTIKAASPRPQISHAQTQTEIPHVQATSDTLPEADKAPTTPNPTRFHAPTSTACRHGANCLDRHHITSSKQTSGNTDRTPTPRIPSRTKGRNCAVRASRKMAHGSDGLSQGASHKPGSRAQHTRQAYGIRIQWRNGPLKETSRKSRSRIRAKNGGILGHLEGKRKRGTGPTVRSH